MDLLPWQQAIRAKCFHPTGTFIPFKKEDVDRSIPELFEEAVNKFSGRLAIKYKNQTFTYRELNEAANRIACAIVERFGTENDPVAVMLADGEIPGCLRRTSNGIHTYS
jgi:non-ribosomal peptide synthetase component F